MLIRDYNKVINIQNGTNGNIEDVLSFKDFDESNLFEPKISLGDFLLLRRVKSILEDNFDVIIKVGYKN